MADGMRRIGEKVRREGTVTKKRAVQGPQSMYGPRSGLRKKTEIVKRGEQGTDSTTFAPPMRSDERR